MLHQLIDFAGLFTPVTVAACFFWGHSRGYKQGYEEGYDVALLALKPKKGPNGKFVKKGAA